MAFGYDGSVRIKADLNHSPFDRGLSSMTKQVNAFGGTLRKIGGMVAMAFGTAALINFGKESIKLASDIEEVQNVIDVTFGNGAAQIEEFAKSAAEAFGLSELSAKQYAGTMGAMLKSSGLATGAAQEMSTTLAGLAGDLASFYNLDTDTAFEKIRSGISGETEPLKQLGINMSVANLEAYALSQGITKSYNAMSQAEQVLLRYNYLLSVTTDAQGDFARTSGSFANQIRILQLNFDQLRIAVGNALIPIAQAVLPGINAIISALTKLATVFSQVTALLFGKSAQVKATSGIATSAGAAADATDRLAESTAGAGSAAKQAAKDLKGVLAGFDELNILATSAADSTNGGAGGGIDTSIPEIPSFESEIEETSQLEEAFSSLGELFIKTLDDMIAAIPGLRDALLGFAADFNEFNQKLYDAFTFPGVLERVKQLGHDLAAALNDFVLAIDWDLWGRTLGAGLNLGLNFLTSFLYEFDWITLGESLASFINGLVYEVDWYEFGRLMWAQFKIALETFAGFILGLDMPELAQAASNIIKGFFDSMQETIAKIDWAGIGRQIAEFLNNIDWVGVINSMAGALREMVGAALEMLGGFIQNADTGTLIAAAIFFGGKLVRLLISKVLVPIGKEIAGNLIKKIAESITAGGAAGGAASLVSMALKGLLGGISVAVGITLLVNSIKDIIVNGTDFKNVVTGLIGGALAGAGIGFVLGGPAGAAIGAVLGVGLTLALEGVVSQITGGVDIAGALMTIVGTALAGAGIGFAVGGPVGAGVGAVIGLVAGIVLEITGIRAAGKAAYEATEDFQTMTRVIGECEDSSNRSSAAMESLSRNVGKLTASLADVGAAQSLADEIYAINDNANASSYELKLMATKVEVLNGMGLDDLHLTIDETTGRIVETKEATDRLISSIQKEAEAAALQELLVQAYKNRYQAVADAEEAVKNVNVAEQALAKTERQLTNTPWWDLQKHSELTAQQEKQTEALEAATEARNNAVTAYDELSGEIDTYSASLTNLSEPESSVGVELESRMDSVRSTVEGVAKDMPGYGEDIGSGLENGITDGIKPLEGNLNETWDNIDRDAKTKFDGVKGTITQEMDGLKDHDWGAIGSSIMNGVKGGMEATLSSIATWARGAGNRLANALKGANTIVSSQGSGRSYASSYAIPETYSTHNLPHLANGAVIPPNQQFAAILGDQRSGMNIEAPANLIKQMVSDGIRDAMSTGAGSGQPIQVNVMLDKKVLARAMVNEVNSMTRSAGKSPLYG